MTVYLDTSAAFKAVIREPETASLLATLDRCHREGSSIVSSMLLFTELHCAARRRHSWDPGVVNGLIGRVHLIDVDHDDLVRAGTSEWGLRSADSIHLATALRIGSTAILTYDAELASVAARVGLRVTEPR